MQPEDPKGAPPGEDPVRAPAAALAEEMGREAGEWKADLLVLGAHGRRTGSSAPFGSTVGAVLRGPSCNALVIPVSHAVPWHGDVLVPG
jgi:nucleotide-binding universal stress UspA family protein